MSFWSDGEVESFRRMAQVMGWLRDHAVQIPGLPVIELRTDEQGRWHACAHTTEFSFAQGKPLTVLVDFPVTLPMLFNAVQQAENWPEVEARDGRPV